MGNTWYIYNVETNKISEELECGLEAAESHLGSNYDTDLYAMTNSPAFGCVDGLSY